MTAAAARGTGFLGETRAAAEFLAGGGIAALLLTTFVFQPHYVPTSSMAPGLRGFHQECRCGRCGHAFAVAAREDRTRLADRADCPNCGLRNLDLAEIPVVSGDRLLALQAWYSFRGPQRWEPAVFRPLDDPRTSYIKRIVALPGESVRVRHGDVFIDGAIARKPPEVFRAVALPVRDFRGVPTEVAAAWWSGAAATAIPGGVALGGTGAAEYVHRDAAGDEAPVKDYIPYNADRSEFDLVPVSDLAFAATVLPEPGTAAATIVHQAYGGAPVELRLDFAQGEAVLRCRGRECRRQRCALRPGAAATVWFGVWDRQAAAEVAGAMAIPPTPLDDLPETAGGIARPWALRHEGGATFRDVVLTRDLHYSSKALERIQPAAVFEAYQLGADEYFALGDNSLRSRDSRDWEHPAVPARALMGKPALLFWPLSAWRIPGTALSLSLPDFRRAGRVR